jgi:hypothetical protein
MELCLFIFVTQRPDLNPYKLAQKKKMGTSRFSELEVLEITDIEQVRHLEVKSEIIGNDLKSN